MNLDYILPVLIIYHVPKSNVLGSEKHYPTIFVWRHLVMLSTSSIKAEKFLNVMPDRENSNALPLVTLSSNAWLAFLLSSVLTQQLFLLNYLQTIFKKTVFHISHLLSVQILYISI